MAELDVPHCTLVDSEYGVLLQLAMALLGLSSLLLKRYLEKAKVRSR